MFVLLNVRSAWCPFGQQSVGLLSGTNFLLTLCLIFYQLKKEFLIIFQELKIKSFVLRIRLELNCYNHFIVG